METTANLRTKILDVGGFDSSRILALRGGILRCIRDFPEIVCQRILGGIINISSEIGRNPVTARSRSAYIRPRMPPTALRESQSAPLRFSHDRGRSRLLPARVLDSPATASGQMCLCLAVYLALTVWVMYVIIRARVIRGYASS